MSRENVEIVRRTYEAYAAGDIAALRAASAPDLVTVRYEPDAATGHGLEGFLQVAADWISDFDEFSITADELIDAGEHVIVRVHQRARGKGSGVSVEADFWFVHTLSNGQMTRLAMFATKGEAFKAAGLGEHAVSANVDLVRSLFADWGRGKFGRVDWAQPGIEYAEVGGPQPGEWTGVAAMAAAWAAVLKAWEGFRIDADDYRELDEQRVLVLVHPGGRGRTSGLDIGEIHAHGAVLLHVRDGTVTRFVLYWDRDRAFADLGLKE